VTPLGSKLAGHAVRRRWQPEEHRADDAARPAWEAAAVVGHAHWEGASRLHQRVRKGELRHTMGAMDYEGLRATPPQRVLRAWSRPALGDMAASWKGNAMRADTRVGAQARHERASQEIECKPRAESRVARAH